MNFELYDNAFQIVMFGSASLISLVFALHFHARNLLIMAFAYASFMMGTLYYTLHLAIVGDIPHISYVAEILWLASYLFYLTLQISRTENLRIRFHIPSMLAACLIAGIVLWWHILGPLLLFIFMFSVTVGAIMYLSVFRVMMREEKMLPDLCLMAVLILQIALYIVSAFMEDFTKFNLYFAVDMTLTMTQVSLIPLMYREVKHG